MRPDKSIIVASEDQDAMCAAALARHDDVGVGTHANRVETLSRADEAVEVEGRRQHLHAVVVALSNEHEAIGRDPHLARPNCSGPSPGTPMTRSREPSAVASSCME
jgi:hypothetical protein